MLSRVVVEPHDPSWAGAFEAEAPQLLQALGSNLVACHHIGSTAIPGIYAKPIIDVLVEVVDIDAVDVQAPAMEALGYEAMGECGIAGRRFFRRNNASQVRTHHVHVFAEGTPGATRHIAFRDFMRAHPAHAREYSELKRGLASAHPQDIGQYMAGKDSFIKDMERRALAWCS